MISIHFTLLNRRKKKSKSKLHKCNQITETQLLK